jgi:hypothetical protein
LEGVVVASLRADGRDRVGAQVLAAHRTSAVRGVDERFVREVHELVQGIVEQTSKLVGRHADRRHQVGPADIADEQGVAGEDGVGLARALCQVEHQERHTLRGVARGFEGLNPDLAEFHGVPISQRLELVLGPGPTAQVDLGTGAIAQLQMAGQEVGVEVGQEHVFDLKPELFSILHILIDVALRIDDSRRSRLFVTDQVRGMGQASQVVLLQNHGVVLMLRVMGSASGEKSLPSPFSLRPPYCLRRP